jgi:protein-tyrosine phosphatase
VIDLHCHLLPRVDDGAPDLEASLAMARASVGGGVEAIVATPHVSASYPTDPATLARRCAEVQEALDDAGVPLRVHTGAELASSIVGDLGDDGLRACALGGGSHLLLEPPYTGPAPFIDRMLHELRLKGFEVVLAHPERIRAFHDDICLLARLVEQGALCSVTVGSVSGQFGGPVKRFTQELFARGLVHNLASDAHDAAHRSPALRPALERAVRALPGLEQSLDWLTGDVPRAILAGEAITGAPPVIEPKRGLLARMRRR